MGSLDRGAFDVKRVAIIGAGPCGLAAAKYLLAQDAFTSIVVYEQNPDVGGVWHYSRQPSPSEDALHVPQTSPFCPPDPPLRPADGKGPPVFATPMYDLLHTNIPWPLMKYGDLDFPRDSLIFPPRQAVHDYLVAYSRDVRHLVRFSTRVDAVTLVRDGGGGGGGGGAHVRDRWDIATSSLADGQTARETFDAVVVASGHYATTYMPEVRHLREFHAAHPGVLSHSKTYRAPEAFAGRKVLVVGNAASGLDIAAQISRHCKGPLLLSVREPTPAEHLAHVRAVEVPAVDEFLVGERGVRFADGRVETGLDAVVYCTGYLFAFPFLEAALTPGLVADGRRVFGLYKHLFHIDHPTLVFPGLPIRVVPFPVSEAQAAAVARVWANALALPPTADMSRWEEEEAVRNGKAFHVFPKGGDAAYLDEFHEWVTTGSSPGAGGKEPPVWSEEQKWQRATYAEAKLKFEMTGRKAKSLAELGFHYEPPSQAVTGEQDIV